VAWNKFLGLYKEKHLIQTTILSNRIGSAYCFVGIDGIGKDGFAIEFAKAVNCYEPIIKTEVNDADVEYQTYTACDNCKSCKMATALTHPNIQFIHPYPSKTNLNDEMYKIIKEQLALKANDIYHKILIPKANEIQVDTIRTIKHKVALSNERGRQFVIVSNADKLNTAAANAFLKTLEEPPFNTTIIITTSNKDKLLKTIQSRCQMVYFNPLPEIEIANYIEEKYHRSETDSRLFATLSQGAISKATEMFSSNMNVIRTQIIDMLRISLKKSVYRLELTDMIANIGKLEENIKMDKKQLCKLLLNLLIIWFRDVLAISVIGETANIVNVDQKERMIKFNMGYPNANYYDAISYVENAIYKIDSNADPKLTLITLFLHLRNIFHNVNY
jgi:DNA polymerase-3 subunit delta'